MQCDQFRLDVFSRLQQNLVFCQVCKDIFFKNFEGFPECRTWKLANNIEHRLKNPKREKKNTMMPLVELFNSQNYNCFEIPGPTESTYVKTKNSKIKKHVWFWRVTCAIVFWCFFLVVCVNKVFLFNMWKLPTVCCGRCGFHFDR